MNKRQAAVSAGALTMVALCFADALQQGGDDLAMVVAEAEADVGRR